MFTNDPPLKREVEVQHKDLRTDLWTTMSLPQLHSQRDMILDKLQKLNSLLGMGASQGIINLQAALQIALKDIGDLIDNRTSQSTKRRQGV